jgi:trimethylamine--corrinoid protein Co-methyltransferase
MAEARTAIERRTRRRAEQTQAVPQPPWGRFQNPLPPLEFLNEEGLKRIEDTAFRVLEELGLEFMSQEALDILAKNGATVDRATGMVRIGRDVIRQFMALAPPSFEMHARNPERNLIIGGNNINFTPVGSAPNVCDLDNGRRPGTFKDQVNLIKLFQSLNCIHSSGGTPVEALDLPADSRHLDLYRCHIVYSDRVWQTRAIGRQRVRDGLELIARARGVSRDQLRTEPSLITIINTNSPRKVDKEMLNGLMEMAENGQIVCVTPFTLAGAMSPITIAGALALQTAEALAVLAFVQMVNPGNPIVFGGFTSNVDMKTGAPAFGTPEYVRSTLVGGQIARRWRIPYRSSNVNAANAVDAQATYESAMSLWACVMAHANFVQHGVGWLEGGLVASFEKTIVDAEMIECMRAWLAPMDVSDDALAFEAIKEVPPGGHFFGATHTLSRFETAFHRSLVSDVRNFENWRDAGSPDTTRRANAVWKRMLESYQQPYLDPARLEAVDAYIAMRKPQIEKDGIV